MEPWVTQDTSPQLEQRPPAEAEGTSQDSCNCRLGVGGGLPQLVMEGSLF